MPSAMPDDYVCLSHAIEWLWCEVPPSNVATDLSEHRHSGCDVSIHRDPKVPWWRSAVEIRLCSWIML
jgi:hypothetical protein